MLSNHHLGINAADQQTAAVTPAWRAKADRLRLKHRIARITGHAFTDLEYQEFDNMDVLDRDAPPRRKNNSGACDVYDETKQPPLFGLFTENDLFALEACDGLSGPERAWIGERRTMLSSGRWLSIRAGQSYGHHPYQYHAKKRLLSGQKKKVHFLEIALDAGARETRFILELVRLVAMSKREDERGSVVGVGVGSKILYRSSLDLIIQKGERGGSNGRRSKRIKGALSNIFSVCWRNLGGEWKRIFKQAAMIAISGNFVTFSLNLGNALLDKYKADESRDTLKKWHDRIGDRLRNALKGLDYSYALERDSKGRWHVHGIIYNMHEDDFNERYAANLRDAGGRYSEQAEDHQLHIHGGYGFERAIGWAGYSTKTNRTLTSRNTIWYESHNMTSAGKALFDYARAALTSQKARRNRADNEADKANQDNADIPAQVKVLEKIDRIQPKREETDTVILKSEKVMTTPVSECVVKRDTGHIGAHQSKNTSLPISEESDLLKSNHMGSNDMMAELEAMIAELDAKHEEEAQARHKAVMHELNLYDRALPIEEQLDRLFSELDAELKQAPH